MPDIDSLPKHSPPINPDIGFWGEMSSIIVNLRPFLAEAVVLLAKETAGVRPLLALDFEVLHGYLFPNLQSKTSRVSTTLASYVVDRFPHRFVLPPGTLVEFLNYTRRRFPLVARLQKIHDAYLENPSSSEYRHRINEAISLLNKLSGGNDFSNLKPEEPEQVAATLARVLADVDLGFSRLKELYSRSQVVALDDIDPEWAECCERDSDLVTTIFAQLSAVGSHNRSIASNKNDARNISTVLSLTSAARQETSSFRSLQLLTETRPLHRLYLDDYGADHLCRELLECGELLPGTVDARKYPWHICRLGSAALYTALHETHQGKARDALYVAKKQFADWEGLNAELYRANLEAEISMVAVRNRMPPEALATSTPVEGRVEEYLVGPAKWYLRLRTILQRESEEFVSRRSLLANTTEDSVDEDSRMALWYMDTEKATQPIRRLPHILSRIEISEKNARLRFAILGVTTRERSRGQIFPCQEIEAICAPTGELVLRKRVWKDRNMLSLEWDSIGDADNILDGLADVFSADECRGELLAIFNSASSELGNDFSGSVSNYSDPKNSPSQKRLSQADIAHRQELVVASLPLRERIPVSKIVQQGINTIGFELPSSLVIRSSICDAYITSPFGAGIRRPTVTLVARLDKFDTKVLAKLLGSTHVWSWSSDLEPFVTEICSQ